MAYVKPAVGTVLAARLPDASAVPRLAQLVGLLPSPLATEYEYAVLGGKPVSAGVVKVTGVLPGAAIVVLTVTATDGMTCSARAHIVHTCYTLEHA